MAEYIDVRFPIRGDALPTDHGYHLFGAVSALVPAFHQSVGWGIHCINGRYRGPGTGEIELVPESRLVIRLPHASRTALAPLGGRRLQIGRGRYIVEFPEIVELVPHACLESRIVVIRGAATSAEVAASTRNQLHRLGIDTGGVDIQTGKRRVVRVNQISWGFAMRVSGLDPDASIAIQEYGIGGRRHMGAGIFVEAAR